MRKTNTIPNLLCFTLHAEDHGKYPSILTVYITSEILYPVLGGLKKPESVQRRQKIMMEFETNSICYKANN